ncbi:MAG: mevalonate kinase [Anaerolinea sp.]|nr:mevalonate kinase [Anaerolinea sp.]
MPAFSAYAPGKSILFGEHAAVYARPALAVPISQVRAHAIVRPRIGANQSLLSAPDLGLEEELDHLPEDSPLALAVRLTLSTAQITHPPAMHLRITSTIPRAAGLGSSAAVSIAIIRAVAGFLGISLSNAQVSALAYQVETLQHGTPSGVDNTVIAFEQPIYFIKGQPFELLRVAKPFTLVIADSGIQSSTAAVVGDVRRAWQQDPSRFESLFDAIRCITDQARAILESGETDRLGPLMDQNHALLQQMTVSCPELDHLASKARQAGALGAKLSGGGRGGNLIALARPEQAPSIAQALCESGAVRCFITRVEACS